MPTKAEFEEMRTGINTMPRPIQMVAGRFLLVNHIGLEGVLDQWTGEIYSPRRFGELLVHQANYPNNGSENSDPKPFCGDIKTHLSNGG